MAAIVVAVCIKNEILHEVRNSSATPIYSVMAHVIFKLVFILL